MYCAADETSHLKNYNKMSTSKILMNVKHLRDKYIKGKGLTQRDGNKAQNTL